MYRRPLGLLLLVAALAVVAPLRADDFRVRPYLQYPTPEAMTLVWFSEAGAPGTVEVFGADPGQPLQRLTSQPVRAEALSYPNWESATFFDRQPPEPPFRHRVRVSGLRPDTSYPYTVTQGATQARGRFRTAPAGQSSVRLVFFADSETEPESTGTPVDWPAADGPSAGRVYPLDQTDGLAANLRVILEREPDLLAICGDLVESGGEQRDWDEFWRQLTDVDGVNLAGRIPLLAAPGNHDYYEGPRMGRYDQPGSERAIGRFLSYFVAPDNGDPDPRAHGRYYRLDYGPVTLIALDVTNGSPSQSPQDTNYYLLGAADGESGGGSPGFGPGSRQYEWLEAQLADARTRTAFTFVFFHHVPYSVGPHGWPPGKGDGEDQQSGVPVRQLTPLFQRYGVAAVIAGHDEIWERSEVAGEEVTADGTRRPHTLQVYDVGIAGDGLRGPQEGLVNPYQKFLAHSDAPEVWRDGVLVAGGKHYGHLEVEVLGTRDGGWQAVLKPVHVFPRFDADGVYLGSERRLYDDVVTLDRGPAATAVAGAVAATPEVFGFQNPYPNPFNGTVLLRFQLAAASQVRVDVYDSLGQRLRRLVDQRLPGGSHAVEWDATDTAGQPAGSGVYYFGLSAGARRDTIEASLVR